MPDQRSHVDRRCGSLYGCAIIRKARVGERLGRAEQVHRVRWIAPQAHRRSADAAVADDDGGHALAELGQHLRLANDHRVVVGMHIDEAWREHAAGGVDVFNRAGIAQVADAFDATGANGDVGAVARRVAAIDDQRIADKRVVQHVSLPAASDRRRRGNRPGRV